MSTHTSPIANKPTYASVVRRSISPTQRGNTLDKNDNPGAQDPSAPSETKNLAEAPPPKAIAERDVKGSNSKNAARRGFEVDDEGSSSSFTDDG